RPCPWSDRKTRGQRAVEFIGDRAGHQDVLVGLPPIDQKMTAWKSCGHLAAGKLEPRCGGGCRAGSSAAGAGQARSSFPHLEDHAVSRIDTGKRDVGSLGK